MIDSYIYNKVKSIYLLFTLILFAACGAEDSVSTKYRCSFAFYTQNHPSNSLTTALEGYGTYTIVTTAYIKGNWHVYSTLNDGNNKTEDIIITAKNEEQMSKLVDVGANNGIILGRTNFNGYVAWDRQCPNCINQYGNPNFPLEWNKDDRQAVTCNKCLRTYSLETGNIINGSDGDRLMQYLVSYSASATGTGKVIWVYN